MHDRLHDKLFGALFFPCCAVHDGRHLHLQFFDKSRVGPDRARCVLVCVCWSRRHTHTHATHTRTHSTRGLAGLGIVFKEHNPSRATNLGGGSRDLKCSGKTTKSSQLRIHKVHTMWHELYGIGVVMRARGSFGPAGHQHASPCPQPARRTWNAHWMSCTLDVQDTAGSGIRE